MAGRCCCYDETHTEEEKEAHEPNKENQNAIQPTNVRSSCIVNILVCIALLCFKEEYYTILIALPIILIDIVLNIYCY